MSKSLFQLIFHPDKLPHKYKHLSVFSNLLFSNLNNNTNHNVANIKSIIKKTFVEYETNKSKYTIYCIYFIYGMGCTENENETKQIDNKGSFIKYMCDYKNSIPIKTILKTLCYLKPSNNKFTKNLTNTIQSNLMNDNHKVLLFGHSYGGALVNLITKELNENINIKENLLNFYI